VSTWGRAGDRRCCYHPSGRTTLWFF